MGASSSSDASGYWAGFVPRLQMITMHADNRKRLVVPVRAVSTCGLTAGDTVYFRDALSHSFPIVNQYQDGKFLLGSGWARMLKKIDCSIGDQVLLKCKGGRTRKVFVFSSSSGGEKFPRKAAPLPSDSTAQSSNEVTNTYVNHGGHGSSHAAIASAANRNGAGTMEHPIELDDPREVVFNASGSAINPVMAEFFDSLANTFDIKVPMYFAKLDALHVSCDFLALPPEYGSCYLLPALVEAGYPDVVNLCLNGGGECVGMRFKPAPDGSVVLSGGWAAFLGNNSILEGATIVLRFDIGAGVVNVHLYDF